jgi:hypothetical protein
MRALIGALLVLCAGIVPAVPARAQAPAPAPAPAPAQEAPAAAAPAGLDFSRSLF